MTVPENSAKRKDMDKDTRLGHTTRTQDKDIRQGHKTRTRDKVNRIR